MTDSPGPLRSFDPRLIGRLECQTWVHYYRREWVRFLWAAVRVVRAGFRLPWLRTIYGAWLVLRANQHWAPVDNRPERARAAMARFYALVARQHHESTDVVEAARLEVEWWRLHRERQHGTCRDDALAGAVAALYAHVYAVPIDLVRQAAQERVVAMDLSDEWVEGGRRLESPLIAAEQAALVRSYAGLLAAVHRI